ncbi:MAG TPA: phosphoribosylanthranilate isomerase [Hyphomicrobiales bacterium]|nr:phosphoribosylanthranilate isomerase [Hyphomicrobiales bacterium]
MSLRIRVKICGITRSEDAMVAAEAGADAIGLVFYPPSPRAVSLEQAREILRELPPFVTAVGLFVNPGETEVNAALAALPLDILQFHGDESPQFCAGFARPYIKALRVVPGMDLAAARVRYADGRGVLFDAWHEALYGGTGESFDWSLLQPVRGQGRTILAGGLRVDNVAQACRAVGPWAVDVSSGVEEAPGIKSAALIRKFIDEVHHV